MIEAGTPEWHAERAKGIGGSDWTGILNIEPYGCRRKVFLEKVGVKASYPKETTGAMERGNKMEDLVADEAAIKLGRKVMKTGNLRLPTDLPEWWIGNQDRKIVDNGDGMGPGVLELKTANEWVFRKFLTGKVDEGYRFQTQHYLGRSGWKWGAIFVLEPSNWKTFHLGTEPDPQLLELMLAEGNRFWDDVEKGREPSTLEAKDTRCQRCPFRLECYGDDFWNAIPDKTPGTPVNVIDPALQDLATQYDELRSIEAEAKADKDKIRGEIIQHLDGKASKLICGPFKVSLIDKAGASRFNRAAFKKDHPDLEPQYVTKGAPSQMLRIDGGLDD